MNSNSDTVEHVYVDEAGGTELPASDADDDYYVVCGILCPSTAVCEKEEAARNIVSTHAGTGELKSSQIGNKVARRRRILEDIAACSFSFYCLAVDKSRIWRDSGLRWRPSFYKFLHQMFYTRIKGSFTGIKVLAHAHGRTAFMEGFKEYMRQRGSLFDTFDFQGSPAVPLLQIADVIGGTVRRVFMGQDPQDLLEIGESPFPIEVWPPMSSSLSAAGYSDTDEFDQLVFQVAVRSAREFVELHIMSQDNDKQLQAEAVRYLLFRFNQNPEDYIYRSEMIAHLRIQKGIDLSEQVFSTKVLAPARDAGVILASTDKGVKIPFRVKDLRDWIGRANGQVVPYLHRIQEARNKLLIASHNNYDIIEPELFPDLAKYLKGP